MMSAASTPLAKPAAAYDADDRRVVTLDAIRLGDVRQHSTWEWDRNAWTAVDVPVPLARSAAAMATDPAGGILLFGGIGADGAPTNESWRYASRRWSLLSAIGPGARAEAAMTYDVDHHRILLRGGAPCADRALWSWDGLLWSKVDSGGPPPLRNAAMTYDPATRTLVLAGGHDCAGNPSRASWRWDGAKWSRLSPAPLADALCLVYSPTRMRMLLFGIDSAVPGSAWQLRGANWERITQRPPALADATCAVDLAGERIVLVGRPPGATTPGTYLLLR
jgi:hypothetical protein